MRNVLEDITWELAYVITNRKTYQVLVAGAAVCAAIYGGIKLHDRYTKETSNLSSKTVLSSYTH